MTGKTFSTFPLTRTTGIMQFTDPALTTSSSICGNINEILI